MSKARIAALAVAIAMIGMPVAFSASAASAATSGSDTPSVSGSTEFSAAEQGEDDGEHHKPKTGTTTGNTGSDDHGYIPPVVIRPHEDGDQAGEDDNGGGKTGGSLGGSNGGGLVPGPTPSGAPTPIAAPSPGASVAPNPTGAGYGHKNNYVVAPLNSGQNPPGSSAIGSNVQNIDPQAAHRSKWPEFSRASSHQQTSSWSQQHWVLQQWPLVL